MHNKIDIKFSVLYAFIVVSHLICSSVDGLSNLTLFTKPAILSSLMVFFLFRSLNLTKGLRSLMILALIFSLTGDVALMFDHLKPEFFMIGLGSFLIAHLLYITMFWKQRDPHKRPFRFLVLIMVYALILFYHLKDHLGELLIPVVIYMFTILGMATTAFIRKQDKLGLSYKLVLLGAVLFMISDSILAFDKFSQPLPYSTISIMTTYALAQYCITMGILKHKD